MRASRPGYVVKCCRREPDSARPNRVAGEPFVRIRTLRNRRRNPPFLIGRHWHGCREVAERAMTILKWALIFFLVSIVAGILGFTGISAASADIARFLFYVFVVIFLVLLILGLTIFRA
jgi:uncharacterized membrane protein YtjA (UPF0391 family)